MSSHFRLLAGIGLLLIGVGALGQEYPSGADQQDCADCHQALADSFSRSLMSRAAVTETFIKEWQHFAKAPRCLGCHAPRGGQGVVCRDCHGDGGHPFARLDTGQVCSRCHDAPTENTFRSASAQALRSGGCLDCHLAGASRVDHAFAGPRLRGFAKDTLTLRLVARNDDGLLRVESLVRHAAGHALPGGTTGRAIWLQLRALDETGFLLSERRHRYGWEHDGDSGWVDHSLPAEKTARWSVTLPNMAQVRRVEARLIYQFVPGDFQPGHEQSQELAASVIELH